MEIEHFGNWLRRQIALIPEEQKVFCERSGIPFGTLQEWLKKRRPPIQDRNLTKLARGLKMEREEIEAVLASVSEPAKPTSPVRLVPILNRAGEGFVLPERIPLVNKVSASRWSENTDLDYPQKHADNFLVLDDPDVFALICEGDCMEPEWHDGECVIFSPREVERNGFKNGDDYCLQLTADGDAKNTFKRVFLDPRRPEFLLLRCANPFYEKEEMRVRREDVLRAGKAIWAMRSPARTPRRDPRTAKGGVGIARTSAS